MPRKKGKKQTNSLIPSTMTSVIFAKCTGCQANKELQACMFCQYPECAECIEKHRQADKLAQRKAMLETRINHLREETGKKNYFDIHTNISLKQIMTKIDNHCYGTSMFLHSSSYVLSINSIPDIFTG